MLRRRRHLRARRDPRLDKKKLWKDIDKDLRRRDRQKLLELRESLRELRSRRPASSAHRKTECRDNRANASRRAREILEKAKSDARAARQAARSRCSIGAHHETQDKAEIRRLRAEIKAEQEHQRVMRRLARSQVARTRLRPTAKTRGERMGESDDEVRQNIPHELVPLWNRVRRSIKGSARQSRTEAFLRYAEEHPSEHYEAIDDKTDDLVRELERQQRSGRRDVRLRRRRVRRYHAP